MSQRTSTQLIAVKLEYTRDLSNSLTCGDTMENIDWIAERLIKEGFNIYIGTWKSDGVMMTVEGFSENNDEVYVVRHIPYNLTRHARVFLFWKLSSEIRKKERAWNQKMKKYAD